MAAVITPEELGRWVNNPAADPELLKLVSEAASDQITQIIGGRTVPWVPMRLACLTLASDLYERRNSPNGVRGFGVDGVAVRIGSDDTRAARGILAPFLPPTVD